MSTLATPGPSIAALVETSKDPRDKQLVIRQITPDIVTFSIPFHRGGLVPIGGRSTAVRLSTGIFVYVSSPPSDATRTALAQMGGEVKWLVTPDGEHGMNIEEFTKAYPAAQPIGVSPFKEKKPNIKWAGLFGAGGESQTYGFEPDISLHQVSAHINNELVAIHHPSGTLIEADMLFNLPSTEQFSRAGGIPFAAKLFGGGSSMSPGGRVHGVMVSGVVKDKALVKRELQPIIAAKWDRIIPCHGEVIESGGRVQWDKVWAKYA